MIQYPIQSNISDSNIHTHNGVDSIKIKWININQKKGYAVCSLQGTSAAVALNYGVFFILPFNASVTAVTEVHETAGTDGGSVTLQVEKLTGNTASGSGSALLVTAINLKAAANVVQNAILNYKVPAFNIGDRLGLTTSGTLTSVTNVTVVVELTY